MPFLKDWLLYLIDGDKSVRYVAMGSSKKKLLQEAREQLSSYKLQRVNNTPNQLEEVLALYSTSGKIVAHTFALQQEGTALQKKVWAYLVRIPAGEVRTYSEVASAIGKPKAVRAVASACARNRIALLVPCHRVVRADGSHSNYRWGEKYKENLLFLESK